ncbi:lipopolysaccharide biosynthesis protein [Limnohabitans sp. WS1]|uniref:lipopolysaccharide biosynthesis protein n=1 Tax=Limnohabitans sp. WS1 TaxID=1100726 RepID=UPI000D3B211F|nr:oligosaccharide flippase family protein [Limnohabitans sp. WS1]PUE17939.1 hypothetical protein B9Z48_10155 [Limnohabitans sp. WS1]
MSLLRQSGLAAASAILLTGSRFVFTAILARAMPIESFGQFAYTQWIVDITFLVCSFGATGAAGRYLAEYRSEPQRVAAFLRAWQPWAIALPGVTGALVLAGAWLSGYVLDLPTSLSLSIWGAANGYMALYTATLVGLQRFELILVSNVVLAAVMLAGAAWLPLDVIGLTGLFTWMAVASLLAAMPGWVAAGQIRRARSIAVLQASDASSIKRYAINMWLVGLLWSMVWSRGELPFVKAVLGDAAVAGYVAALTIFGGAMQGVMLGMSAVAPQLTRLIGEGKKRDAVQLARRITEYQLIICVLAVTVLALLAPEIIGSVFGGKYESSAEALTILSFGIIPLAFSTQNHILQIETNGKYSLLSTLIGLILLAAFSYLLVERYEISGAAFSRMASIFLVGVLSIAAMLMLEGKASIPLLQIGKTATFLLFLFFMVTMLPDGDLGRLTRYSTVLLTILVFGILLLKKIKNFKKLNM